MEIIYEFTYNPFDLLVFILIIGSWTATALHLLYFQLIEIEFSLGYFYKKDTSDI